MVYEQCKSKVVNLLATIDERVDHDKIEVLIECIVELEKEHNKLKKQFEDHKVLSPEFLGKEAEFQKHVLEAKPSLKERNKSSDKDTDVLREELGEFAKSMKEE